MRKITCKSLNELAKVTLAISEENQKMYVGGTSRTTGYIGTTGTTIGVTSSAAHPQVSTGYSSVRPVYDNNAQLIKNSYYFDVGGSDLDVVITVPVEQIKNFESLYKKVINIITLFK